MNGLQSFLFFNLTYLYKIASQSRATFMKISFIDLSMPVASNINARAYHVNHAIENGRHYDMRDIYTCDRKSVS